MKNLFVKSILGVALALVTASASTIQCADQTLTGVGGNTLDKYIALNGNAQPGCMVGNLLFSGFAYSYTLGTDSFYVSGPKGTGLQINASAVTVAVDALNDKFSFNGNWIVNHYQTASLSLSFNVSAPPTFPISKLQNVLATSQGGVQNGGPTHTLAVSCTGGTCASPTSFTNASVSIAPTPGVLHVTNSIVMNARGSTNSSINNYHLSIITDQFTATASATVPEPVTGVIIGSSLIGLALLSRKRRQA